MKRLFLLCALLAVFAGASAQNGNARLDPSFANKGILIDSQEKYNQVNNLAVQPDGKIVVVGADCVARYLSNGTPDSSFAGNGHIAVNTLTDSNAGYATKVFLLSDGKIIVILRSTYVGDMVARLKPDGTFDSKLWERRESSFLLRRAKGNYPNGWQNTNGRA